LPDQGMPGLRRSPPALLVCGRHHVPEVRLRRGGGKTGALPDCPVYRHNVGDEIQNLAEAFDYMAWSLKNHIEELRLSENKLGRQKQLLKTILDVTPDLVALQDENMVYLAANKAFCSHLGREEEQIIGKTDFDLLSAEQADQNYHEDMQILLNRVPLSKEIMTKGARARNGTTWSRCRWSRMSGSSACFPRPGISR
jgi:PAS domain S-box-containing protein